MGLDHCIYELALCSVLLLHRSMYVLSTLKQISEGKSLRLVKMCTSLKGKAVLLQAWSGPDGSRKLRFPDFMTTAQDGGKFVSPTHRPPLPPGNAPGTHFCQRLSQAQGHSAIGRIMSIKNSHDTIWCTSLRLQKKSVQKTHCCTSLFYGNKCF